MFIDTHTHLFASQFNEDIDATMERALNLGVKRFYLPNIDVQTIEPMMELAHRYPKNCFPMMGLHPSDVKENYLDQLAIIETWLEKETFWGIGETGIDLYWDKTHLEAQKVSLKKHAQWAKQKALPLIIHVRDSFNEVFEIIDEVNDDQLKGIFHCFTGNAEQAQHIIDYGGFKMGIGGVVTFKNSGLDKVIQQFPLNHFVLETDSPYLAPTPFRGQRNESSYLIKIAEKMAEIFTIELEEIAEETTKNANAIFNFQ